MIAHRLLCQNERVALASDAAADSRSPGATGLFLAFFPVPAPVSGVQPAASSPSTAHRLGTATTLATPAMAAWMPTGGRDGAHGRGGGGARLRSQDDRTGCHHYPSAPGRSAL